MPVKGIALRGLKATFLERILELDDGHEGIPPYLIPYGELKLLFLLGSLDHVRASVRLS